MKVSINAIQLAIDAKFSEIILASEVKEGDELLSFASNQGGVHYRAKKIDTRDTEALVKLFEKELSKYMPLHPDNTKDLYIETEIEEAKEHQKCFRLYKTNAEHKTYYFVLQRWIDFLDGQKKKDLPVKDFTHNLPNTKRFYTDNDYLNLIEELQKLQPFQVNDFLEFHYSQAFKPYSMAAQNWLTGLYKNLFYLFPKPKITGKYGFIPAQNSIPNIDLAYLWVQNKIEALVREVSVRTNKPELKSKEPVFNSFMDIFNNSGWEKYISALEKTDPPLLNMKREFIGKPRPHKGVICSWIKYLQTKGIIKANVNRSKLASVLNSELQNFSVGKDGKTFDNVSNEFEADFKEQLIKLTKK